MRTTEVSPVTGSIQSLFSVDTKRQHHILSDMSSGEFLAMTGHGQEGELVMLGIAARYKKTPRRRLQMTFLRDNESHQITRDGKELLYIHHQTDGLKSEEVQVEERATPEQIADAVIMRQKRERREAEEVTREGHPTLYEPLPEMLFDVYDRAKKAVLVDQLRNGASINDVPSVIVRAISSVDIIRLANDLKTEDAARYKYTTPQDVLRFYWFFAQQARDQMILIPENSMAEAVALATSIAEEAGISVTDVFAYDHYYSTLIRSMYPGDRYTKFAAEKVAIFSGDGLAYVKRVIDQKQALVGDYVASNYIMTLDLLQDDPDLYYVLPRLLADFGQHFELYKQKYWGPVK